MIKDISLSVAHFSHELAQHERFEAFNACGELPVAFEQKRRQRSDIQFVGFRSDPLSVWWTRSEHGFWTRRTDEGDLFTLRFTRTGKLLRRHQKGDFVSNPSQAIFTRFNSLREEGSLGTYESLGATITYDAIREAQQRLGANTTPDIATFVPVADANEPKIFALQLMLRAIQVYASTTLAHHDLTLPLFKEALIYQILTCWPASGIHIVKTQKNIASKGVGNAIAFIEANLHRRLTVGDIADACDVSLRALHSSFKIETGQTPMSFVIDRRFEQVHRDLQLNDGSGTVSAIAFKWGIIHMGQFGREYRRRYGCSPNETLRSRP